MDNGNDGNNYKIALKLYYTRIILYFVRAHFTLTITVHILSG